MEKEIWKLKDINIGKLRFKSHYIAYSFTIHLD